MNRIKYQELYRLDNENKTLRITALNNLLLLLVNDDDTGQAVDFAVPLCNIVEIGRALIAGWESLSQAGGNREPVKSEAVRDAVKRLYEVINADEVPQVYKDKLLDLQTDLLAVIR